MQHAPIATIIRRMAKQQKELIQLNVEIFETIFQMKL